ncbi:hypothetical protein PIB30_100509, partial [Stylosanthes scabra]|nr:hypothetical protein [Stylosanthes scabra]
MRELRASSQQRSRLSTALMRGLLLNPRTHQSHPTHMREQSSLCVVKHFRVTLCAAELFKEATKPTHMRELHQTPHAYA